MENSTESTSAGSAAGGAKPPSRGADERLSALSSLLHTLDEAAQADGLSRTNASVRHEEKLTQVRLGMASSLFAALRAKHSPSASHSLRVALGVSSWTLARKLPDEQCDKIEVAALLHDVGKIGVPDHVLLKPGQLTGEEFLMMDRHRQVGREILGGCCSSDDILDIIFHATAWYDGSKHGFDRAGSDLPLGSRMIAIVDAFDAMTTDHVYRPAMSRERAVAELFEFVGTQFDPELVEEFCQLLGKDRVQFDATVSDRWLRQIHPETVNGLWSLRNFAPVELPETIANAFHAQLLASMHDGVVFVDAHQKILMWNRAAERLTGTGASSVLEKQWSPRLVGMCDERGKLINDADCPVVHTMRTGAQTLRRLTIKGRQNEKLALDVHFAPVLGSDGTICGATLVLHDASSQITLEERVQTLHEKATRDPLTKVGNRAEFDRVLPEFVETHLEQGISCSMIICDIDHFKKINDTHGHQAGDEALITFASLLQRHARAEDLVARYGGEEFVILCADCDNATATNRAEEIRRRLAGQPQPSLTGECITASFGVTEVQGGDTPETFLRRADRALLQAKDNGRNLVVQLGMGIGDDLNTKRRAGWLDWLGSSPGERLLERRLVTVVPLKMAAEKLRGFVADHHAEILSIDDNRVSLKIDGQNGTLSRRWSDRPVPFLIELTFDETNVTTDLRQRGNMLRTLVTVVVRPKKQRDRRRRDVAERARQLLVSLKSYLMAHDYSEDADSTPEHDAGDGLLQNAKQVLSYWLRK